MTASMPGPGTDCKFSCAVCSRRLQVLQTFGRIRVTGISSSYSSYDNLNTRLRASEVLPAGLGSVDRNRCPSLLTAALDPVKSPGQGLPGGFNGLEFQTSSGILTPLIGFRVLAYTRDIPGTY